MKTIVGVRFRKPGKVYFFDPGYIQLNLKDKVVVETTMGEDVGEVVINKRQIPDDKVSTELKRIVRLANNRDLKRVEDNKIKEQKAMKVCKEKIKKYKYCTPFTKESLLYREIFESYYPNQASMIKDFWMPNKNWKGCNVNDPSARYLSNYGDSGK